MQFAKPDVVRQRLLRVEAGEIHSALDEFLARRIPIQLGGMADPFSRIEEKERRTYGLIAVLNEFDYPFIISTKSDLVGRDDYLALLAKSNGYVRFSTTVVDPLQKGDVDVGCPPISSVIRAAKRISSLGVPVAFRLQPIIPGHESTAEQLIDTAAESGAKHISAEYLKVPIDADIGFGRRFATTLGGRPVEAFRKLGAAKIGREYILSKDYRSQYLPGMYKLAKANGLTFGFADNDLLLHSDGQSCCGASDRYLRRAGFFSANIVGVAKRKRYGERIQFEELARLWMPERATSTYLNSKTRIRVTIRGGDDWIEYLRRMWQGQLGTYSPLFFDGIDTSFGTDGAGLPIYVRVKSHFEELMAVAK